MYELVSFDPTPSSKESISPVRFATISVCPPKVGIPDRLLSRRLEEHDAALSAEVPLEVAIPRRLGREVGGAQAEGQRRGRNASDDHAHHRLPP